MIPCKELATCWHPLLLVHFSSFFPVFHLGRQAAPVYQRTPEYAVAALLRVFSTRWRRFLRSNEQSFEDSAFRSSTKDGQNRQWPVRANSVPLCKHKGTWAQARLPSISFFLLFALLLRPYGARTRRWRNNSPRSNTLSTRGRAWKLNRKRIPTLAARYASTKNGVTTGGLPRPIFLRIPCRYSTQKSCGRGRRLRACACSTALVCLHPSAAHRHRTTQNTCRWKRSKRFGREPTPRSRWGYPAEGGRCADRGKRFFWPRESTSLGRHFSFR